MSTSFAWYSWIFISLRPMPKHNGYIECGTYNELLNTIAGLFQLDKDVLASTPFFLYECLYRVENQ